MRRSLVRRRSAPALRPGATPEVRSRADAVAQVCDVLRGLLDVRGRPADQFEFDVVGRQVLEERFTLSDQNRDQVNLQLVEDAGGKRQLSGAAPWTSMSFSPAASLAVSSRP